MQSQQLIDVRVKGVRSTAVLRSDVHELHGVLVETRGAP